LRGEGDAAHAAFGGIVGQADATVVEEAGERGPALEHVVHGLGDLVAVREFGALISDPGFPGDGWPDHDQPDSRFLSKAARSQAQCLHPSARRIAVLRSDHQKAPVFQSSLSY
jgi:hypothetical protein